MALPNDIVDLMALGADEYVVSGAIVGPDLVLDMASGGQVIISLGAVADPDQYLAGVVLNGTTLDFTMQEDGVTYSVDLAAGGLDTFLQATTNLDPLTGQLTFEFNNGVPSFVIDFTPMFSQLDDYVVTATYNCATQEMELVRKSGVIVPIDMTCFIDMIDNMVAASERGGVAYDPTIVYVVGDIAVEAGTAYISLTGSATLPSANPGDWKTVAMTERGGIAHSNAITYLAGDIVTVGRLLYIATVGSTGVNPVGNPGTWQEYNTVWHTALSGGSGGGNLHNPTGDVYPDVTAETLGASYTISGLGAGATYTYAAGNLAGTTLKDGDTMVWTAGDVAAPLWLHVAKATITAERGGIAWASANTYFVGDVVVEAANGYIYTCILDVTSPTPPSLDAASWDRLNTGSLYDPGLGYEEGDLVVIGDDIYLAPVGGVPVGVTPPSAPWMLATPDERGGIVWNGAVMYLTGDVASEGEEIYLAVMDNTSSLPSANPASWKFLNTSASSNTVFDPTEDYEEGDMITIGDDIYIAPVGGVPAGPFDPTDWVLATPDEKGGIAWNATVEYVAGDTVVVGQILYLALKTNTGVSPVGNVGDWFVPAGSAERGGLIWEAVTFYQIGDVATTGGVAYIALTNNDAVFPQTNPTDWEQIISAGTFVEQGGRAWGATVTYELGDVVSYNSDLYVALLGSVNVTPGINPLEWEYAGIPERGGLVWDSGIDYAAGDTAIDSTNGELYASLTINIGSMPSGNPLDWQLVNVGGIAWVVDHNYKVGDTAIDQITNMLYMALVPNAGVQPSTDSAIWRIISTSLVYDPSVPYEDGSIVIGPGPNFDLYILPPGAGPTVPGTQPPSAPWVNSTDGRGILHDMTIEYVIGDVATEGGKAYVALTDNLGALPSATTDIDWRLDASVMAVPALKEPVAIAGIAKYEWDPATQILNIITG